MFKIPRSNPWPPTIDLSTVRQTIAYMQGDMARIAGLEKIAAALDTAIREIDAVQSRPVAPFNASVTRSRFLPRRN